MITNKAGIEQTVHVLTLLLIASSMGVREFDMVDSGRRSADCTALRSIKE